MDLQAPREHGIRQAEAADQDLDILVDVGAIESRDARFDERRHVDDRLTVIDCAMVTGELPAALDDAGNVVARRNLDAHAQGSVVVESVRPGGISEAS